MKLANNFILWEFTECFTWIPKSYRNMLSHVSFSLWPHERERGQWAVWGNFASMLGGQDACHLFMYLLCTPLMYEPIICGTIYWKEKLLNADHNWTMCNSWKNARGILHRCLTAKTHPINGGADYMWDHLLEGEVVKLILVLLIYPHTIWLI